MPVYTTWYVVVTLEVARKQQEIKGPDRSTEEEAEADLDALREHLGKGEGWINLDWISANPANVAAAHIDSTSAGFF